MAQTHRFTWFPAAAVYLIYFSFCYFRFRYYIYQVTFSDFKLPLALKTLLSLFITSLFQWLRIYRGKFFAFLILYRKEDGLTKLLLFKTSLAYKTINKVRILFYVYLWNFCSVLLSRYYKSELFVIPYDHMFLVPFASTTKLVSDRLFISKTVFWGTSLIPR